MITHYSKFIIILVYIEYNYGQINFVSACVFLDCDPEDTQAHTGRICKLHGLEPFCCEVTFFTFGLINYTLFCASDTRQSKLKQEQNKHYNEKALDNNNKVNWKRKYQIFTSNVGSSLITVFQTL